MRKTITNLCTLLFLLTIILLLHSCAPTVQISDKSRSSFNVQRIVRDKISQRFWLHCCGGGESCPDNYKEFFSAFQVNRKFTKDDGRHIVLEMAAIYYYEINNNEEVRPYLCEYPFPTAGIHLVIFIYDKDLSDIYYPELGLIGIVDGSLIYKTYDPEKLCGYKTEEEETIEEALEILEKQGRLSDFVRSQLCND